MKLKSILLMGLIVFVFITLLYVIFNNNLIFNVNSNNLSTNLSTIVSPTISTSVISNSSLDYPPNDYAINLINWSSYPNLSTGYVYTVYIAGPNEVIAYKFIEVQICTEIKETENKTIILEQLNSVAREAKKIYGPNSSINIIGTKGGIARWFASILPYEDTIYN